MRTDREPHFLKKVHGGAMGRLSRKTELEQAHLAAKIAATEARAEKTRLETAQRRSELVERSEVELDAAEAAVAVSRALERIPQRVAAQCAGADAQTIARVVAEEIEAAMDGLRRSAYAGHAVATEATEKPKRRRGRPAAH